MADEKGYNGWKNYETWNVALWIDNEQGSSEYWNDAASEAFDEGEYKRSYSSQTRKEYANCRLADRLKAEFEEAQPEVTGMWADLLNAAMSEAWLKFTPEDVAEFAGGASEWWKQHGNAVKAVINDVLVTV